MKINYNVTGANRKSLAGAISKELNAPAKYLGMPTAAYDIGGYTVTKTGELIGRDNVELVANLDILYGFKAVIDRSGEQNETAAETGDLDCGEAQHYPGRYADPNVPVTEEMLRQAEAWMDGQPNFEDLRMTEEEELGLGRQRRENYQGENGMQASDLPERYTYRAELSDPDSPERMEVFSADNDEDALRQAYEYATGGVVLLELHELDSDYNEIRSVEIPRNADRLIIEMPKDGFTETTIANLRKLVESKAALIKKALGTDNLPIEETGDTLRFPWFTDMTADNVNAYTKIYQRLLRHGEGAEAHHSQGKTGGQ